MFLLVLVTLLAGLAGVSWVLNAAHFRLLFLKKSSDEHTLDPLFADRYRPMLRLLNPEDVTVYSNHPACSPADVKRLRAERIRFFRSYLRSLVEDYSGTLGNLERIMLESSSDRPDLARAVESSRFRFAKSLLAVEWNLVLYKHGLGQVNVAPLVDAFFSMRQLFATPALSATPA